jgi:hypothetical protein
VALKTLEKFGLVSYNYFHIRMSDEERKCTGGPEVNRNNSRGKGDGG